MAEVNLVSAVYGVGLTDAGLLAATKPRSVGRAGLFHGFPTKVLAEGDLPRLTFFFPSQTPVSLPLKDARAEFDEWAWPLPRTAGEDEPPGLHALDEAVLALWDRKVWHHGGVRIYTWAGVARDMPSGVGEPFRRTRDIFFVVG